MVVLLGVLVVALVAGAAFVVIRRVAVDRAIEDARQLTLFSADVVEQRVSDGIVTGDAAATGQVATVIGDAVLHDPVVHVKLWSQDGTILYSDELKAIGKKFESGASELDELSPGQTSAEISDLSAPENQYELGSGPLLEVYTPIETPDGTPLLFETYQRYSSIDEQRQQLLRDFAPVLIVALIALAVLLIPLGWTSRGGCNAWAASGRRRCSARSTCRTGSGGGSPGICTTGRCRSWPVSRCGYRPRPSMRPIPRSKRCCASRRRRCAAVCARSGRRSWACIRRTSRRAGSVRALEDLTSRLRQEGLEVSLDVADPGGYGSVVDQLLYRVCQEALRNVEKHAGASHATIRVARDGSSAVLEVVDDGRGIAAEVPDEGHLGLQIVDDLVRDAGGTLSVTPGAQGGTVVRVEVPTS